MGVDSMISFRRVEQRVADDRSLVPLHHLKPGETGFIAELTGGSDDVHRLEEFGLQPGVPVEMFRSGSPCIVRVRGQKLCLRPNRRLGVLVHRPNAVAPKAE
ncbi:MAG: hypothetical protein D6741_05995 [Planctomycetota bacterium]|nr:MAG: hypothetical protein D6741_05995 [Planctomycetota bacterium]